MGYVTDMDTGIRLTIALVILVTLSGCLGSSFTYVAEPATIESNDLSAAGYDDADPEAMAFEEEFTIAGQDIDVDVTTWAVTYERSLAEGQVSVISTPDASVLGQSVNPLARLSGAELLSRLLEETPSGDDSDFSEPEEVAVEERTILGQETTVRSYESIMDTDAGEVPVMFHLATVQHGDDVILLLGVHPQEINEREPQLDLMESVTHTAD